MDNQTAQVHRSSGAQWLIALLVAACLVQSFLIFRLSSQVKDLQTHLLAAETKMKANAVDPLLVGEVVPTLGAIGRDGQALTPNVLDFSADRLATVVVAMGTACPVCEEMLPQMSAWARQTGGDGVVIVGVQLDATKPDELKKELPGMQIVFVKDARTTWLRRVTLVPSVLVFDREGTLRAEHPGVMDGKAYKEIETVLAEARATWK